jgi:hypothetical protein
VNVHSLQVKTRAIVFNTFCIIFSRFVFQQSWDASKCAPTRYASENLPLRTISLSFGPGAATTHIHTSSSMLHGGNHTCRDNLFTFSAFNKDTTVGTITIIWTHQTNGQIYTGLMSFALVSWPKQVSSSISITLSCQYNSNPSISITLTLLSV